MAPLVKGNATSRDGLIRRPRTWKLARSFKSIPSLSDKQRLDLKSQIESCRRRFLDSTKCWTRQEMRRRDRFMEQIVWYCPFLIAYEKAWPAEGIAREVLSKHWRRMLEVKREGQTLRALSSPSPGPPPSQNKQPRERPAACVRLRDRPTQTIADDEPIIRFVSADEERDVHVPAVAEGGAVKRFLTSLKPNLGRTVNRFQRAGIRTEEDLSGLAAMLPHRRKRFLSEELHFTAFEIAVIGAGLEDAYLSD